MSLGANLAFGSALVAAFTLSGIYRARKRERLKRDGVLTLVTITLESWSRGVVRFKLHRGFFTFRGQEIHFKDQFVQPDKMSGQIRFKDRVESDLLRDRQKPCRIVARVNPRKPTDYVLEYEELIVGATYLISVDNKGKAFDIEAKGAIDAAYDAEAARRIRAGTFPKKYRDRRGTIELLMESPLRPGVDEVRTAEAPAD